MGQPVAMFEFASTDAERARSFYSELFGWSIAPMQDGYSLIDTDAGEGAIPGGIGAAEEGEAPHITVYVRVDDLQASLDKASSLGGTTIVPPTVLPGDYGSFAIFADPDGVHVGLWA